jgi:peptidoglycan/LPS O-acetylase OafA/YrhL
VALFARRALRIMPAYFVVLAIYFLLPSWRESRNVAAALEISVVGVKHRTSWRHGVFTHVVARG